MKKERINRDMRSCFILLPVVVTLFGFCDTIAQEIRNLDVLVRTLVEQVMSAKSQDEQQSVFDEILNLGCPAIPAITAALDDNRTLPIRYIRLKNESEAAFEKYRQYSPETVTDALAAVLNQLTERSPVFIYNGPSQEDRRKAIEEWRLIVQVTPQAELCQMK